MVKKIKKIVAMLLVFLMIIPSFSFEAQALTYSGSSSYKSGKFYTRLTNVTLTGDQRTDIVNIAKSQVGYQEGSSSSQLAGTTYGGSNYTEYGRWYGLQDMWCAMFVSWCANVAGVSTSVVPKHSYTPTGLNWFKNKGQAYSRATVASGGYTPQPGDIIYFKSSRNQNITNHVGIVTKYSGGTVYTVEGNTSSATISTNGGAVCEKSYSISNTYIVYICKPSYTNTSTSSWLKDEGKATVFDAKYYSSKYSDLAAAFGTDEGKLFEHFLEFGIEEGRCASPIFDIAYYVDNNATIKSTYGTDYMAAMKYYVNTGIKTDCNTAESVNLGDDFEAKIKFPKAGLNLSLSDTNVITYTPSTAPAQIWNFKRQSDGTYKIVNTKQGYCLNVEGASTASGANINIAEDNGSKAQRWNIYEKNEGEYIIRSACSPACVMDVANGSTDTLANVGNYTYNGTTAQVFTINKTYNIATLTPSDVGTGFYAKITATSGKNLSLVGTDVILYTPSTAAAQHWKFERQSDGSYKIINQKTGQCLEASDGGSTAGTNVLIDTSDDSASQRWFIYKLDGKYALRPACSSTCVLDVKDNSSEDLTNIQINTFEFGEAQQFKISKVAYIAENTHEDLGTDFYANITSSSGKNLSILDKDVIIYTSSVSPTQIWKFERQGDGSYKIINRETGECLEVTSGEPGASVHIGANTGSSTQKWYIYKAGSKYVLRSACSENCVLEVPDNSSVDETKLETNTLTSKTAQKFTINEVQNTGWVQSDGKWYYFDESGVMKTSCWIDNTYYMKADGTMAVLEVVDNGRYYVDAEGKWVKETKWVKVNDNWYYLISGTVQKSKWARVNDKWYYFDASGIMQTSRWINSTYYVKADGTMAISEIVDSGRYYVDAEGKWVKETKWIQVNGYWYYLEEGVVQTSKWIRGVYYVKADGTMAVSEWVDDGKYYVGSDGKWVEGALDESAPDDCFENLEIQDIGTDFYAKITASSGKNLSLSGTNVILYTPSSAAAQMWKFERQSDGSYILYNNKTGECLEVADDVGTAKANVQIGAGRGTDGQKWNIYLKEGKYVLRPKCSTECVLDVTDNSSEDLTNIQINTVSFGEGQLFEINKIEEAEAVATPEQMEVIRKIIYAVETGGQVYGNVDYSDFTEAYTNSDIEHAITIGGGQWYGVEAKTLLNLIRATYPAEFEALDTAGIAADLDSADWSTYKLSKTSAKAKCIQAIIGSPQGIKCQDKLIDDQMTKYIKEAEALGVTDLAAQMMCANIRHQGGSGAVTRILNKTTKPYTLDSIYEAMQSDTGNQVGTYTSRQKMVYNSLKTYLK
ncbi:MAG: RICIN domain-containing protein [Lachnospiraceae bacterium]|nr:RICIN domain-containing protein [Lachnospiraceae bacterium]